MLSDEHYEQTEQVQIPGVVLRQHDSAYDHHGVPKGFTEIITLLIREILREQPADIMCFSVRLLETMIRNREDDKDVYGSLATGRQYLNYVCIIFVSWLGVFASPPPLKDAH